jgi:predicted PurR-regulated permease PerM
MIPNATERPLDSIRLAIGLACFVVISAGCKAAASILVPLMLSVFIAAIFAPFLFWMQRHRIPTVIGVIVIFITITVIAMLLVTFVSSSVTEFTRRLPQYQKQLADTFADYLHWLDRFGIEVSNQVIFDYLNPGKFMSFAAGILTRVRGILTNAVFIGLTVMFILFEAAGFPKKLAAAVQNSEGQRIQFKRIAESVNRYLFIKTLTSLVTGVIITLMLIVIDIDFPVLWGLVMFLLNFIPALGPLLAAIPAILLAIIQAGMLEVVITCIGYFAVNTAIGSVVEPRIFGSQIGLSPLVVFISLIFWGWIFGPIGMLLSVPLSMIAKIALEENDQTRWLAILLGPNPKGTGDLK